METAVMRLTYEGTDIAPRVSIARAWLDMHAGGRSDELQITCADTRALWDAWGPKEGDRVSVEDGLARSGEMIVDSVVPQSSKIGIRALAAPTAAMAERRWKSWEEVRFLQLVTEVASRHGLSYETHGVEDHTYSYVEQPGEPDLQFLDRRCAYEGCAVLVYDGRLVVYGRSHMDSQTPSGVLEIRPGMDYEFRADEEGRFGSCRVTDGTVTGTFSAGGGKEKVVTLRDKMTDVAEGDRFARNLLRLANEPTRTIRVATDTFLRQYAPGSVVEIRATAASSWDGPAFVTDVRHDFVRKRTTLRARQVITDY